MNKNVTWWQAGLMNLASMLLIFFLTRTGNASDVQNTVISKKADIEYVDKQDAKLKDEMKVFKDFWKEQFDDIKSDVKDIRNYIMNKK